MESTGSPDRRMLISVDMQRYSHRDNSQQFLSQRALHEVLQLAADRAGLDRRAWTTQHGGDSELAIMPADTCEPAVISNFVPAVDQLLAEYNRDRLPQAKVRVRIAVHQGLVHLDGAMGFPGQAVVEVCRLCDAGQLKQAMTRFGSANVGLIVSDCIYRDLVCHGYRGIRRDRFAEVTVDIGEKDFLAQAWIFVPDEDVTQLDLSGPEQPGREPDVGVSAVPDPSPKPAGPSAAAPTGISGMSAGPNATVFTAPVTAQTGAFGTGGMAIGTINFGDSAGEKP